MKMLPRLGLSLGIFLSACSSPVGPAPAGRVDVDTMPAVASDGGAPAPSDTAMSTDVAPAPPKPLAMRPFICKPSTSPMFTSREILDVRISADFNRINGAVSAEESKSEAVVEVGDKGSQGRITAQIRARGISRFKCGFRPFKITFPEKQKGNVFEHLGKSVKFVTHCGDRDGLPVALKAPSIEAYEQRVLMEHAVYQVLDPLQVPSLKTRLVRLTYHDTKTNKEETHLAFVREPEDEMAQRCGMVLEEEIDPARVANRHSELLMYLLNNFVIQYDWGGGRNTIAIGSEGGKERLFAPYDFDLVGIFRPDYSRNQGRTLQQNSDALGDWLRRNRSATLFGEIDVMLAQEPQMQAALDQPGLTAENRQLFSRWLSSYLGVLRKFRGCEGKVDDSSQPHCHVEDDHAGSAPAATIMPLIEWKTRLEPPGDIDTFAVKLQAGTLHTLGGEGGGELLVDLLEGQTVLARASAYQPVSLKIDRTGTYYIRTSRGSSLVCSPIWPDASAIESPVFIYEDDHAAAVETATPLTVGNAVKGEWEPKETDDEDWFLLKAGPATTLDVTIRSTGVSGGRVVVAGRNAPDKEISDTPISRGANKLTSLFPEPDEYVVRIIQDHFLGTTEGYSVRAD